MRIFSLWVFLSFILASGESAQAGGFKPDFRGTNLFGSDESIQGPVFTLRSGFSAPARQLSLSGEVGYGWGSKSVFGQDIWHIVLAPTVDLFGSSTKVDVAAIFGRTIRIGDNSKPIVTVGLAGGVETRILDELHIGPTVKLSLGIWWVTLFVQSTFVQVENPDGFGVLRIGLEYMRFP